MMYQFLILACLVSLVAGKCNTRRPQSSSNNGGGYWGTHTSHGDGGGGASEGGYWAQRATSSSDRRVENSVAEIARKLIDADRKMDRFCTAYSDRGLREVYGVEHFQLRVTLTEFSEEDIEVRVRQRLVSIHVQDCTAEYAALRILPDVADPERALWKFQAGELTVLFPYNVTPDTKIQSQCGRKVSEDVIVVPRCARDQVFTPDYDLSFGNDRLKEAIKRYIKELATEGSIDDNSKEYFDDN